MDMMSLFYCNPLTILNSTPQLQLRKNDHDVTTGCKGQITISYRLWNKGQPMSYCLAIAAVSHSPPPPSVKHAPKEGHAPACKRGDVRST